MTTNQGITDFSIAAILRKEESRVNIDHQLVDPVFSCLICKKYISSCYLGTHHNYCYTTVLEPDKAPTNMTSMRQVSDSRAVFQCPYCKYHTRMKGNFRVHFMTHTGERPFQCDLCGKRFVQQAHLNKHMHTHTGVKPYKCYECDYSTGKRTTLDRHVATIHTGERFNVCNGNLFNYSTADCSNIRSHCKAHTGEKPYRCPYSQ